MPALPGLVIIGGGGFGCEMVAWAEQSVQNGREWKLKGIIDDFPDAMARRPCPAKWLGKIADYEPNADEVFVAAIGKPAGKRACSELISGRGGRFTQLHHRTAVIGNDVQCGEGVILCPYSVVTSNVRLGRGVAVNLHSSVDHDAVVGDWTQINCHCDLTGGVVIGSEVWFSSHVSVAPSVKVGDRAYLGMGAMVLRDVEPGATVAGNPARRIG